jgi:3-phenylpropionate/trans-cinnamate dioxygenase ferredoxin reductase component
MATDQTFVIVGASLTGAKAAEALRDEGFDGSIVLIGAETERPYERPPLSKDYLLGTAEKDVIYVHEAGWYADHDVDLRLGTVVTNIHRSTHSVELIGGEHVRYDKLLLATGATPRKLRIPGSDLDGVHYLRTAEDSELLRDTLRAAGKTVVVGAGWIGLETAAAARSYGGALTIVEPEETPLARALGPEIGTVFADLHRRNGVEFRLGSAVSELHGDGGRVREVLTSAGESLDADAVVIGVGVTPNTQLADDAGLDVDNGIITDESLRTSDPDIYAAGDVANSYNPLLGRRIRVEHWANALDSGPAAGRAMLGQPVTYDKVPYFFTDQYDLGMEYAGYSEPGYYDEVIYRGDRESMEFIAFWLMGGRVVAGMNVNVWDVTDQIQDLIRSGRPVDRVRLADPQVPLPDLMT